MDQPISSRLDSKVFSSNKMAMNLVVNFIQLASLRMLGFFSWALEFGTSLGSLDNTPRQNDGVDINVLDNKIVILTFGNAPESQYIYMPNQF